MSDIATVGLIINSYGRQFIVEVAGVSYLAVTKSKKTEYVVGDKVMVNLINQEQLQIIGVLPRNNLVYRSDQHRSKIIASNIDQMLIVIAVKPKFNINFLDSCLVAAEAENVFPIIIINKTDLPESAEFCRMILNLYAEKLDYKIIQISALNDCSYLRRILINKQSLLIGQSGVGKSTITNAIVVNANTKIGAISKSENSGRHTTTNATLYYIDKYSTLVDCPGLQDFGLYHLRQEYLTEFFPEVRSYHGMCKFRNCAHINEPGCALITAFKAGIIAKTRFSFLQSLTQKLQAKIDY